MCICSKCILQIGTCCTVNKRYSSFIGSIGERSKHRLVARNPVNHMQPEIIKILNISQNLFESV